MSVESVARSTSITTVSRPTCGHTEVSTASRGQSSGARPPRSPPVSPPGPLVGDLRGPQSLSLLLLSTVGGGLRRRGEAFSTWESTQGSGTAGHATRLRLPVSPACSA